MARKKPKPEPSPATPAPTAEVEAGAAEPSAARLPVPTTAPATTPVTDQPAAATAVEHAPPPAGPKPFAVRADSGAGVTLREDRRFRQVQFQFRDKPSDAVRMLIRQAGFTWQPTDRVWVKPIDRENGWQTRMDAQRLFDEVVGEIIHEQGPAQSR